MSALLGWQGALTAEPVTLLNASYDPTGRLYADYNAAFSRYWQQRTGQAVRVEMSNGGSSKQARALIAGLEADVATLALAYDIDTLHDDAGLLPADWQKRLPDNSCPYTSTIVLLVRKGNPKKIVDWEDLARPGIAVITPSPKTSGGARWNYLAAWAWASKKYNGNEIKIRDYMGRWLHNVPVFDGGARGATLTFVQRGLGDVLLAWENEAYLALEELGRDSFEIVTPSLSILAEPPVSWLDGNTAKHRTTALAKAYLEYLYSFEGQTIVARHHYRPHLASVAHRYTSQFGRLKLVTVEQVFGGWRKAQRDHFDDGGSFDQLTVQK
ncbi:sulfate ABC transporter substrate-binding protein [Gloeobacter kilaueensis]|uniref:Sulfate ABC transporter periplasmic sulfate-binding protein n=1 Tax=Gloeobacter kilaueensis (strain ATCC BAA-2537 / CCAP 1431/1 / ULC 316 / JS1) TaxID=1183438 RepID=U5QLR2_GLOK1|nr:sulfate ABC transporter substrate-binding protein [Gloeobacter kilaueensis]AGY58559.1 sulfate ABC transporter periplasmic sulfate-binding protein [Gloeobacter kilaueensis JS1]